MPYVTGTRPASANQAQDFIETVIDPLLVSVGFTYVKTSTALSQFTFRVYRAAAGNWYLLVGYSPSNNNLYTLVCEEFNDVSNAISHPAPRTTSQNTYFTIDSSGRFHITNVINYTNYTTSQDLQTSGLSYWVSATSERLIFSVRVGATDYGIYCGTLTSVPSAISSVPAICHAELTAGNVLHEASFTREPGVSAGSGLRYCLGKILPLALNISTLDCYSNTYHLGPAVVYSTRDPGGYRGRIRDAIMTNASLPATAGDTMMIDGKVYVHMRSIGIKLWVDTTV